MPAKVSQSKFVQKYGNRLDKAVHESRDTPVRISEGGGDLPEMDFGVALVTECRIEEIPKDKKNAKDKNGDPNYRFVLVGIVKMPTEPQPYPDGSMRSVVGMRTSRYINLTDEENQTFEGQIDKAINEMKKLGCDTSGWGAADLEANCSLIENAGIYTKFRTWMGRVTPQFPNPRLNHDWRGVFEGTVDEGPNQVEDDTAEPDGTGKPEVKAIHIGKNGKVEKEVPFGDKLDMIVNDCTSEDDDVQEAAVKKLKKLAADLGYTEEDVDNSSSWDEVAEWIRSGKPKDEGEPEENLAELGAKADKEQAKGKEGPACARIRELCDGTEVNPDDYGTWSEVVEALQGTGNDAGDEGSSVPTVGDTFKYKGFDPKTKAKSKVATEHEVLTVNEDTETVTLKDVKTGKTVVDLRTKKPVQVPFSELE